MNNIHFTVELDHRARTGRLLAALICVTVLLLLPLRGETFAQTGKLYPVDESSRDASFAAFRARLLAALKHRDRKFLMSIVHPKIQNGFGGNDGAANFVKQWQLNRPNSEVWDVLYDAIMLGGTFEGSGAQRMFVGPYVYTQFPDALDPFEYRVVIGKDVPVRAGPSALAPVKSTLSYDIVEVAEDAGPGEGKKDRWVKVILKNGEGYVAEALLRSPVDYRFCFQRVRGKWLMTFLVAGD
jgi:hypothetical protein